MSKPYLVYSAPVSTVSGYGEHARDILRGLRDSDKYDIEIVPQRWGDTPMNALTPEDKFHMWMMERMRPMADGAKLQLPKKPDVWIQVTVPNEFQPIGKWNIGITAGMESNVVDANWVVGMNRMDMNIVPSEHSKQSFLNSVYTAKDKNTGETQQIKMEKPIHVLFEGFDEEIYTNKTHKLDDPIFVDEMDKIEEDFCFLFVGHWLKGDHGHDRKDVGTMIQSFLETFKGQKKRPALVMKTSMGKFGVMDREKIVERIRRIQKQLRDDLPNIYVLHGELTNQEMNNLYNHKKVKAMVSFTKGEGFGRPLLEFTQSGKPIITSNWSGHIDFLNPNYTLLIDGELKNVHQSASWDKMILKESKWFYIDVKKAKKAMKDVFKNYKKYLELSKKQMTENKKFTLSKMNEKLIQLFEDNQPEFPKEIELKLPKLEKLNG